MFVEQPATKMSLAKRKLIHGVGINDANYQVMFKDTDGKRHTCPYYRKWQAILVRVYCPKYHSKQPTYVGSTVCEEWLTFSQFKHWMAAQDWEGKELDKDLLDYRNKHYSPETCLFITKAQNNLLTLCKARRGELPLGVYFNKANNKFQASLSCHGKSKHMGSYDTPEEASKVYVEAKLEYIAELAAAENNPKIKRALIALK